MCCNNQRIVQICIREPGVLWDHNNAQCVSLDDFPDHVEVVGGMAWMDLCVNCWKVQKVDGKHKRI